MTDYTAWYRVTGKEYKSLFWRVGTEKKSGVESGYEAGGVAIADSKETREAVQRMVALVHEQLSPGDRVKFVRGYAPWDQDYVAWKREQEIKKECDSLEEEIEKGFTSTKSQ
ncbi:hypothetical protein KY328_03275 [Candidatus Woesearchaeota archaeon]|nr:hypothetical protein [Candidatus Woesearchaeota archaeon]MBW3021915.1 hypothetical protein [Candidatus Woesearchaeota archaeon]